MTKERVKFVGHSTWKQNSLIKNTNGSLNTKYAQKIQVQDRDFVDPFWPLKPLNQLNLVKETIAEFRLIFLARPKPSLLELGVETYALDTQTVPRGEKLQKIKKTWHLGPMMPDLTKLNLKG